MGMEMVETGLLPQQLAKASQLTFNSSGASGKTNKSSHWIHKRVEDMVPRTGVSLEVFSAALGTDGVLAIWVS